MSFCKLCPNRFFDITERHMKQRHHGMTLTDYYKMFPEDEQEIAKRRADNRQYIKKYIKKEITREKEERTIYSYVSIQGKELKKAIYQAFEGKCFYTGKSVDFETMHIDHLVPKNKGGKDCIANYVLTSSFVNRSKRDKELENIDELIRRNIEIYAPKVLEIVNTNLSPIQVKTGPARYKEDKLIYKYQRILAESFNDMQAEFLQKLQSIRGYDGTPMSVAKLEWLTELYQFWKENKLEKF